MIYEEGQSEGDEPNMQTFYNSPSAYKGWQSEEDEPHAILSPKNRRPPQIKSKPLIFELLNKIEELDWLSGKTKADMPVIEPDYYYETEKRDGTPGEPFDDPYLGDNRDLNLIDPALVLNNPLIPLDRWTVSVENGVSFKSRSIVYEPKEIW